MELFACYVLYLWNCIITLYSNSPFSALACILPNVRCLFYSEMYFPGLKHSAWHRTDMQLFLFSLLFFFFFKEVGIGEKEKMKVEVSLEKNKQGHF